MKTELGTTLSLDDFDYTLPEHLIAKYPLESRDASKMMVLTRSSSQYADDAFINLENYLNPGDLLVLNNAKVLPVRLIGHREGHTGKVEVFLLHPQNATQTEWLALIRPAKKLKEGTIVLFDSSSLAVTITERHDSGKARVTLIWDALLNFDEMLQQVGHMPLPPYLSREEESADKHRYQTVFAKCPGAQAAPTAGLHFTETVLNRIKNKGVNIEELTLSVSAGTFRPVLSDDPLDHKMDPEAYQLEEHVALKIEETRASGHKIVAVGTTVAKTLETIALKYNGKMQADTGWSELFITPGFRFQVVDALLTNFHLPKSTLLMLISAFVQDHDLTKQAYLHAISQQYRFYSYGDCMLII